jgi:hypothetical protein
LKLSTPVENEDLKLKLANRGIEIGIIKQLINEKANIIVIKSQNNNLSTPNSFIRIIKNAKKTPITLGDEGF